MRISFEYYPELMIENFEEIIDGYMIESLRTIKTININIRGDSGLTENI